MLVDVLARTLLVEEETIVLLDEVDDDVLVVESRIEEVLEVDEELRLLGEELCVLACTVTCTVIVATVVEVGTVVDGGRVIVVAARGGTGVIPSVVRSPPVFKVEDAAADMIKSRLSTEWHRRKQ